jgi:hypothetical protein
MRNVIQAVVLVCVSTVALVGCEGGNCPFQRPACCDDNLFGCGPFDLPTGCSCSDYFSRSFQGVTKSKQATLFTRADLSMDGTWRVALTKTSGGCSYLQDSPKATLLVRERSRQVSVKLRGVTTLKGGRYGKRINARGQYKTLFPRCAAALTSKFSLVDSMNASIDGTVVVSCQNTALSCHASYAGKATRL